MLTVRNANHGFVIPDALRRRAPKSVDLRPVRITASRTQRSRTEPDRVVTSNRPPPRPTTPRIRFRDSLLRISIGRSLSTEPDRLSTLISAPPPCGSATSTSPDRVATVHVRGCPSNHPAASADDPHVALLIEELHMSRTGVDVEIAGHAFDADTSGTAGSSHRTLNRIDGLIARAALRRNACWPAP